MSAKRKKYSSSFKSNAVLELLSNQKTLNEVASKYEIDPIMLSKWKKIFLESSSRIFEDPRKKNDTLLEKEAYIGDLEKKVGQLTLERDWLKIKSDMLFSGK